MNNELKTVLEYIENNYRSKAVSGARNYCNVDIGNVALELGFKALHEKYAKREVVVSLKAPQPGMKVRIDGRTFVNYAEYAEGFAVPEHIALAAGLPFKKYIPQDSLILNFA